LGRTGKSSQLWTAHIGTGEKNLITEGDAVQPSWSPNGHRIAYWGLREGGQRDIWTVPSEGGEAVAVTDDGAVDWNPVWSPEGSHLYFSSDRGGSMNLWRVPIDEATGEVLGEFEPVTTPSPWISYISLSRNGRRIVYASEVGTGNLQKISFDPSTERVLGQPTPILRGSRRDTEPDPAPDGERLAFRTGGGQEDIFLIAPDGTSLRQLTDDPARDRLPRWSPDGKRIAFYSDRTGLYQVWTINPDGSGLRRLTDEPDIDFLYAVWSPDGSRMACYDVNGVAWVFDPNTPWKDQTPEKLPAMSQDGDWFEPFSWSPDGRWLAGTVRSADGTDVSIGVFSLETHEYERLTDFGSRPSWLGDSRRLVFASQGKIFLLDRETKAYRELFAPEDGDAWAVSISKDDRTLYFSLSRDEADIWLLTLN
jgi:Tol biopolymer transport system component